MERWIKYKVCAAWLLAIVLVGPFAVQTIHVHHSVDCGEGAPAGHDCETCPVCCFTLSTFTADFPAGCAFVAPVAGIEPVLPLREKVYSPLFIPYGLRAPPAA